MLSIKPEYATQIFEGTKRFEFRKSVFKAANVKTAVVYVTRPVGKIVGEFDIDDIICERPNALWKITSEYSGISKELFDEYFDGRDKSFALVVGEVRQYDTPINPYQAMENFTPPQSYMYLKEGQDLPGTDQLCLGFI